MNNILSDLRLATRWLLARPGFSLTAVLTLALCTGITTTIFSVVDGVILRPLPLPDAGRLVTLCERYPGATADWCSVSPPNAADIAERSHAFSSIGIARSWGAQLQTREGAVGIASGIADAGFFTAIGVPPLMGRTLRASDLNGTPGQVAVVSYEFWQTRLGGANDAVGRVLSIDKAPVTVVGVMPRAFHAPMLEFVELWRPLHIDPRDEQHRAWAGFVAYARLKPGVSVDAARADLDAIDAGLKRDHFATSPDWWIAPRPLQDLVVGEARGTILLFLGAVGLVLLIGCANVAHLLLVRGSAQRHEIAIRMALGASRADLVRQRLMESLLLAITGTALGVLLATWGIAAFRALAPPSVPRLEEVGLNVHVLLFAIALAAGTTVLFGLAPALALTRADPARSLRTGGRGLTTPGGRLGRVLVMAELAVAVVLLAGAALLARTFGAYAAWEPGFDREHLLNFSLAASQGTYRTSGDVGALWPRVAEELRALPGVAAVGSASGGPLFGGRETSELSTSPQDGGAAAITARYYDVSDGYFGAVGIPLAAGRAFDAHDDASSTPVAIINETAARLLRPGASALGMRVTAKSEQRTVAVVGIVHDVPPLRPGAPTEPEIYWPQRQSPRWFTYILVRTSGPAAAMLPSLRAAVRRVDPDLSPGGPATMADRSARALVSPRFNMLLLASFGITALALAAIGVYGLAAFGVAQRTQEIGVRLALGAAPSQVLREVVRGGLTLALPGIAAGIAGALALGAVIGHFVSGVSPRDPVALAGSAIVLLAVTTAALAMPARRASRIDPIEALRAD
jgi:predicted permease